MPSPSSQPSPDPNRIAPLVPTPSDTQGQIQFPSVAKHSPLLALVRQQLHQTGHKVLEGTASIKQYWGELGGKALEGGPALIVPFIGFQKSANTMLGSRVALGFVATDLQTGASSMTFSRVLAPVPALAVAQGLWLLERSESLSTHQPQLILDYLGTKPEDLVPGRVRTEVLRTHRNVVENLGGGREGEQQLNSCIRGTSAIPYVEKLVTLAAGSGILFNGAELSRLEADKKLVPNLEIIQARNAAIQFLLIGYGLKPEFEKVLATLTPKDHNARPADYDRVKQFADAVAEAHLRVQSHTQGSIDSVIKRIPDFLGPNSAARLAERLAALTVLNNSLTEIVTQYTAERELPPMRVPVAMFARQMADALFGLWSGCFGLAADLRVLPGSQLDTQLTTEQKNALAGEERVVVAIVSQLNMSIDRVARDFYRH